MCLIDNLQVASMPGHSIKQRAQRKIAVKLAQITQRNNCFSFYILAEMSTWRQVLYVEVQVLKPHVQVLQNYPSTSTSTKYYKSMTPEFLAGP